MLTGDRIQEVSNEQAFIFGYNRCSRDCDFGICAVVSQHFELEFAHRATTAGFHVHDDAVLLVHDPIVQLVRAGQQSFDELGPGAAAFLDRSERCEPVVQFRDRAQHHAGADLRQLDQSGPD